MANVRVKMSRAGIRALMRNASLVEGHATAVAAACNAESEWDYYFSGVDVTGIRARATVWAATAGSEERANRLVRNLGAGG